MIIMDGVQRIAMVETKTIEGGAPIATPVPKHRFQLGNHLDSALLEVDETGLIISYEEYAPYGTSAYRSAKSGVEVSARRYRYTGKERDDETGLYYYGARYYAAWLGRWTSADPLGIGADGPGLYNYVRGSPVTLTDPNGAEGKDPNEQGWWRRGLQAIAKPLFQATYAPASLLNAAELAGVVDQGTTQAAAEMYVGAGVRAVEQAKAAANPIGTAIETVTRLNRSVEQKGVTQPVRDASPFGNADRASDALSRNDYIEAGKELFDIAMFITGVTKSVASGRPAKINLPPPPAVAVGPEFALAGTSAVVRVPAALVALGQIAAMSAIGGSGPESNDDSHDGELPTTPVGLVGKSFERWLHRKLGAEGSFSAQGREFDGRVENRWIEAKSGRYWEDQAQPGPGFEKFKSDIGSKQRIAKDHGADLEVHSNTPIPEHVSAWLNARGIKHFQH
jgi:RHS repeat-associated protein